MSNIDVSIIIVSFNTKDLLKSCLESIYSQTDGISFEIIVSDNGSHDGSLEMLQTCFPQVVVIENNMNLGFGTANNRGLDFANGKYIFYLNSDTVLLNNAVKYFYDYWEADTSGKLGVLGANLLGSEGQILPFGSHHFPTALGAIKGMIFRNINLSRTVKRIQNGKPIVQNTICNLQPYYGEIGGFVYGAAFFLLNNCDARFDERFFFSAEETDLQLALAKKGLKRVIINGPKIIHLEGASSSRMSPEDLFLREFAGFGRIQSYISTVQYIKKHKGAFLAFLLKIPTVHLMKNRYIREQTNEYIERIWSI